MLMRRRRFPGRACSTSGAGKGGGASLSESRRSLVASVVGGFGEAAVEAGDEEEEALGPTEVVRTDFLLRMSRAFEGKRFC